MPSTPEPSRSAREDDLVKVQRDPGIRRKCQPAAQPWTLGRTDIEQIADDYAGFWIHMTKMHQRHRHPGKLRDPEEVAIGHHLDYFPHGGNRRRETATCACGHVESVTHLADIKAMPLFVAEGLGGVMPIRALISAQE